MDTLIESVVPPTGFYCLTTIHNDAPRQMFFSDRAELITAGITASKAGKNAYYAMASFKDGSSRTQKNVQELKAFWLDVDCKNKSPTVDYSTKEEGLAAIQDFCNTNTLPQPTIVDSGNGWHVYWPLTEAISKDVWQPVAEKLKAVCLASGLRIDPVCTADSARILRIPNTLNYKFTPPTHVQMHTQGGEVDIAEFIAQIDLLYVPPRHKVGKKPEAHANNLDIPGVPPRRKASTINQTILGNSLLVFKRLVARGVEKGGCAQINYAIENQEDIDEPMWRSVLSVAQCCSDADKAIHAVSNKHPDYSSAKTIQKAQGTNGAHSCTVFNSQRPGVCTECPFWGKISSPLKLCVDVVTIDTPVVIQIEVKKEEVKEVECEVVGAVPFDHAAAAEALANYYKSKGLITVPVPPKPYSRGINGGIYKKMKSEDGTFDDVCIYPNDLYAYGRLFDTETGQQVLCRLHLPLDGVSEFAIPLAIMNPGMEFRKSVCKQGVAVGDKALNEISNYLIASTQELQHMQKEEKARNQMGWQEDGSFVVGDREYSKEGIRNCPPSNATTNYQHTFRVEGDLAEWRKVLDVYKAPGFEIHQFMFFLALSSPFLFKVDQTGVLSNLISDESGVGKTTLSRLLNSIWGHPQEMMSMPHDTVNAVAHRMGVFNSITLCIDEITNKDPVECSDLAYMGTHGRGKARMEGSANKERVNTTRWWSNTVTNANASIRDKISSIKASSEGENMRLFEFDMRGTPVLEKAYADKVFRLMNTNHGVAGHIWASWLVANASSIKPLVEQAQAKLDKQFKFNNKERIWSTAVGCVYAAAWIAKELGLHDFDIPANIEVMVKRMAMMRSEVQGCVTDHKDLLSDFLTENHGDILVINDMPDTMGFQAPPQNRNINRIMGRYEPDTGKLFISSNTLRAYCVKRQFTLNSLLLLTKGTRVASKRLAAGTGVVSGVSNVIMFDTKAIGMDMGMWHDAPPAA